MEKLTTAISEKLEQLNQELNREELAMGQFVFGNGECQILTQSAGKTEVLFSDVHPVEEVAIYCDENGEGEFVVNNSLGEWNRYSYAALLQFNQELHVLDLRR